VRTRRLHWLTSLTCLLTLVMVSCAPAAPAPSQSGQGSGVGTQPSDAGSQPARRKVLNMGLRTILDAFSTAASSTTSGGGLSYIEIHSQALFTADKQTGRPTPRLVAEHPTVDNGGLKLTDDGKMIATYKLRQDVKWADGQPFTSKDLMFTYRLSQDPSLPIVDRGPSQLMESATAPDPYTFVVTWKQPYYLADAIGLRVFWPQPVHLLENDYETFVVQNKDVKGYTERPYFSSEYIHIGPFKLTQFNPGVEAVFDAVDNYFLGKPKVDRIVVKQFGDPNTLYANVLGGQVDFAPDGVLEIENAVQLKQKWDQDGGGRVYYGTGTTQFVSIQFDRNIPNYQVALQDKRVRQALYFAIDRDAYADSASAGIPDKAAHALLPPDNPLYSHVKDGFKLRYPFDMNRSIATFEQAGWRRGPNGVLTNAAGETLKIETRNTAGGEERAAVVADMWKKVGVDPEIFIVPAARVRDTEFRQQFPGGEVTARGSQDSILTRLECAEQPTPQNRFAGNNRGHWCTPDYERLVSQYRTSLREDAQGAAIKQIQELVLEELPILPLNYQVSVVFARKGVTAFQDDFPGGSEAGRIYGTYSRNSHEWDLTS
jgi:peptide/nickel transport system substrate-binding protein